MFLQRFDGLGNVIGNRVHFNKPGDQGLFDLSIGTLADGRVIVAYGSETGDATNVTTLNYQMVDPREPDIFGTAGNDDVVAARTTVPFTALLATTSSPAVPVSTSWKAARGPTPS